MIVKINTPLDHTILEKLKIGDQVYISGEIYTARDAAHKRMIEELHLTKHLPFDIANQIIFYMGPCPAAPGEIIGPAGPTTSHRMDAYTPELLDLGLKVMIGKGNRTQPVIDSIIKNHAVYMACVGGTGSLCSQCIKSSQVIAYDDLGTEAIRHLVVENFPAIVAIDSRGNNIYTTEKEKFSNSFLISQEEII